MDNCLKFHDHTNLTITKANRTLGLINKIFQYRGSDLIIKLYGNSVWGPHYITDQKLIEGIQRRATKLISSISQSLTTAIKRDFKF